MINLILYTLSIASLTFSYPSGNTEHTTTLNLTSKDSQDGSAIIYSVDMYGDGEALLSYNKFNFVLENGQSFGFNLEKVKTTANNIDTYSLRFKVLSESYNTNLYLTNLRYYYGSYNGYLPNVYFLGQYQYYQDDESGDFTLEFSTSDVDELYLNFDIGLLDARLIDGSAYQQGYNDGWNAGNDNGFDDGYNSGYHNGYTDAEELLDINGSTAVVIFEGIVNVALLPINFFLACLNFEVFGINIGAFVSSLLTVAIVIILFRTIFSGGNGSKE